MVEKAHVHEDICNLRVSSVIPICLSPIHNFNYYHKINGTNIQNLKSPLSYPSPLFADLCIIRTAVVERFDDRLTYLEYFYALPTD